LSLRLAFSTRSFFQNVALVDDVQRIVSALEVMPTAFRFSLPFGRLFHLPMSPGAQKCLQLLVDELSNCRSLPLSFCEWSLSVRTTRGT